MVTWMQLVESRIYLEPVTTFEVTEVVVCSLIMAEPHAVTKKKVSCQKLYVKLTQRSERI